jgi:hypothetical protein
VAGPAADLDSINLAIDTETFAHVRRLNHRHWAEAARIGPSDWPIDLIGGGGHSREHVRRKRKSTPSQEPSS